MGKIREFEMLNEMPISAVKEEGRYETIMMYFVEVIGTSVTVYKRKYKRLVK